MHVICQWKESLPKLKMWASVSQLPINKKVKPVNENFSAERCDKGERVWAPTICSVQKNLNHVCRAKEEAVNKSGWEDVKHARAASYRMHKDVESVDKGKWNCLNKKETSSESGKNE